MGELQGPKVPTEVRAWTHMEYVTNISKPVSTMFVDGVSIAVGAARTLVGVIP